MQNNDISNELMLMITQLRKSRIKQTLENDQHNTNAFKRHAHTTHVGGRPKKCVDKDVLEHMKNIGVSNVNIANTFSVHRNLVARCIKDYHLSMPRFTDYTNEQIMSVLNKTIEINNNLGKQYTHSILFTNRIRIHQTPLHEILRELKGSHHHNVGNTVNRANEEF